jgi:hypothetical protein
MSLSANAIIDLETAESEVRQKLDTASRTHEVKSLHIYVIMIYINHI